MANVNPGPAQTSTPSQLATLTNVNALGPSVPGQASNGYRLLAVARGVSLSGTGDAAVMQIINSNAWSPASYVVCNGQVSGVQASIATASIGLYSGAGATGTTYRTAATLSTNSAAGSSIVTAAVAGTLALAYTGQTIYVNVATALASATCDIFFYGYDES